VSLLHTTQHVFSGWCVCGHRAEQHHGNCIMDLKAAEATKSNGMLYSECEHFGRNEYWEPCPKCPGWFVDRDDPLRDEKIKELNPTKEPK
jgi:hypothetical protein